MQEYWRNVNALLNCIKGLNRIEDRKSFEETDDAVLEYALYLARDVEAVVFPVMDARSNVLDLVFDFYRDNGRKIKTMGDAKDALRGEVKNLTNLAILGKSYGDVVWALKLCLYLRKRAIGPKDRF